MKLFDFKLFILLDFIPSISKWANRFDGKTNKKKEQFGQQIKSTNWMEKILKSTIKFRPLQNIATVEHLNLEINKPKIKVIKEFNEKKTQEIK